MPGVVRPVASILCPRIMRSDRGRIYGTLVFIDAGVLHVFGLSRGLARTGRRVCDGVRYRVRLDEPIEHAHGNLLANNVDIVWKVDLLQSFDGEAREDANDWSDEETCPECCLSIDLSAGLVERPRINGRRVNSGPEEDEEITNTHNEQYDPVPTVAVDKDVHVDGEYGRMSDVTSKAKSVRDIQAIERDKRAIDDGEVGDEEDHDRLVCAVQHVHPGLLLATIVRI